MLATSASQAISIDDGLFPLVEVSIRDGHRDQDFSWLMRRFERLFAQQLRYALLIDASTLSQSLSPTGRRIVTDWQRANLHQTARWNVGTSVVISSGLIRGALTAMNWFVQQPVPMNYPSSVAEAIDWCVERLETESIAIPKLVRKRQVSYVGQKPVRLRSSG
jgi:hypothetical protein